MDRNWKVYVHISPNGKRYYGITSQKVEYRWKNGKGYKNNQYFARAIEKYGWDNFQHIVIAKGLTEEEAKWLEIELIREWDTANNDYGYNITKGGDDNPMNNEETRKKVSETKKGKPCSEEHRKKISEAMKGKPAWNKGKTGIYIEDVKKKMSEAHRGKPAWNKGKPCSEECRKKISKSKKGKGGKQIYCIELDMYFNTITEASKFVGCSHSNISCVLSPNQANRTAKGYHFIYVEDTK